MNFDYGQLEEEKNFTIPVVKSKEELKILLEKI